LHPNNPHTDNYDLKNLVEKNRALEKYVFTNDFGKKTIDFSINDAVLQLNIALLKLHYDIESYNVPEGYLCPAIPGRVDYLHHISDLLSEVKNNQNIKGLDIGSGANGIYPILANKIFSWKMVGCDINKNAVEISSEIIRKNNLSNTIEIRYQENNANIFEGIIKSDEYFDFTMCNPPFHTSEKEAIAGTMRKLKNLNTFHKTTELSLNFGGQANELWCNGGEALFIKRMIKQSVAFKDQVGWFTSLVSKKENLSKIQKQLDKLKVTQKVVHMTIGNKITRFIAWKF